VITWNKLCFGDFTWVVWVENDVLFFFFDWYFCWNMICLKLRWFQFSEIIGKWNFYEQMW